jgi:glutathione S-transferase
MTVQIVGRSSSHFTRVALIVARELGVPYELVVLQDVTDRNPADYGGNPALKIPALRRGDGVLVGTENICRALAELSDGTRKIIWPEQLKSDVSRNAQEFVWHAMAAQVQLVMGTMVAKLPADNVFFAKVRAGFEGALGWLDANVSAALVALPPNRDVSLFEVTLFCLLDHLVFRSTLPLDPYSALIRFRESFARWPSAQQTAYRFDAPAA